MFPKVSRSRNRSTSGFLLPALSRLRPRLLGFDVFISYSQSDSLGYAMAMENLLSDRDIACFRDAKEIPAGGNITETIDWALSKSRMLIVLVTEASVVSDWVAQELAAFRKRKRPVVAITVGDTQIPTKWAYLTKSVYISDSADNLQASRPSKKTIDRIIEAISFKRRNTLARIVMALVATIVIVLGSLFALQYVEANRQRDSAVHERNQAEQLIEYLVTDLKASLTPIFKLAILEQPAENAWQYFKSVNPHARAHDDLERLELKWRTIRNVVEVYIDLGRVQDAQSALSQMLGVAQQVNDRADRPSSVQSAMLAYSYRLEGDILVLQNDLSEAKAKYERSYRLFEGAVRTGELNQRVVQAWIALHTQMAALAERNGFLTEAIEIHDAALSIIESIGHAEFDREVLLENEFVASVSRGDLYRGLGNRDKAISLYRSAYDIAIERQDTQPGDLVVRRGLSVISDKLGHVLMAEGRASEAIDYYSTSLEIAEELASYDPDNEQWQVDHAVTLDYLGDALRAIRQFDDALSVYERGREIRRGLADRSSGSPSTVRRLGYSHHKVGKVLYDLRRYEEAIVEFRASNEIFKGQGDDVDTIEARAVNLRMLAVAHRDIGNIEEAITSCDTASSIANRLAESELSRWGAMADELSRLCASLRSDDL